MKKTIILITFLLLLFISNIPNVLAFNTTNMLVYWAFNETSGINASDLTGNGYTATTQGITQIVPGKLDNARLFNVTKSNMTAGNALNIAQNFTIGAWVNISSALPSGGHIIGKDISGARSYVTYIQTFASGTNSTHYNITLYTQLNGAATCGTQQRTTFVTKNTFHHFLVTRNRTNIMATYIDGNKIFECTQSTSITQTATQVIIGNRGFNDANMNGTIDELFIKNNSISIADIAELYNNGLGFNPYIVSNNCLYSGSGNWNLDCTQNCVLNISYNLKGNNFTVSGIGKTLLVANLTNISIFRNTNSCKFTTINGGNIKK